MGKTIKPWDKVMYCSECGSTNVQELRWCHINEDEIGDGVCTWNNKDYCWCEECGEHTTLKTLPELWKDLSDIPVNMNDEIEEPFMMFPAGTSKFDIWHWFDERCEHSLHDDLMFPNGGEEDEL